MYELFEQKYKECEKSLFLVAFAYLHNTEDAKDCVQEAVLSALKSFNSLNNKEFFKTWLTRIVINKSKDYLKKQRFTEELTDNLNVFYDMPQDEIGILADSINKLSASLDTALTELKTTNEQLVSDIEKERKLEKMRQDFVSSASHELKTPIAIIRGYAEGLKINVSEEDTAMQEYCDKEKKLFSIVIPE